MRSFADNLKLLRKDKGLSQSDLAEKIGVSKATISYYEQGKRLPSFENLEAIADALNVPMAFLTDDQTNEIVNKALESIRAKAYGVDYKTHKVPLLGGAGCGTAVDDPEYPDSTAEIDNEINADFALRCKGDSMTGARLYNNDLVFFRAESDVDDGDIAAIEVDGEMVIKRVFHLANGAIMLQSDNPVYKPFIVGNESKPARIIGKAIAFRSVII